MKTIIKIIEEKHQLQFWIKIDQQNSHWDLVLNVDLFGFRWDEQRLLDQHLNNDVK
jgi:hypothetical protein